MPNLRELSHLKLKLIFVVHFILVVLSALGSWYPNVVIMYNLLFFVSLMWAIHSHESDEPIQFALIINVLAIIFDVIVLCSVFSDSGLIARFGIAFAAINLVLRAISSWVILKIGQDRKGTLSSAIPASTTSFGRDDYEDISHPVPQTSDFARI